MQTTVWKPLAYEINEIIFQPILSNVLFLKNCQGRVRNRVISIGLSQKLCGNTVNSVLPEISTNVDN